jgi:hypothetical protein
MQTKLGNVKRNINTPTYWRREPPVQELGPYTLANNTNWQDVTDMLATVNLYEISHVRIFAQGMFVCTATGAENFTTFLKVQRNPLAAGYADHPQIPDVAETMVATAAADWYTTLSWFAEWSDCAVGQHLFKMQCCEILLAARTRKLYHTNMLIDITRA